MHTFVVCFDTNDAEIVGYAAAAPVSLERIVADQNKGNQLA